MTFGHRGSDEKHTFSCLLQKYTFASVPIGQNFIGIDLSKVSLNLVKGYVDSKVSHWRKTKVIRLEVSFLSS